MTIYSSCAWIAYSSSIHGNHMQSLYTIQVIWLKLFVLTVLSKLSDSSWHLQWRQRRWQWKPWKVRRPWPKELFWVSWPLLLRWRSQTSPKSWTHWLRSAQKRWRSLASSFSLACVWSRLARRRDLGYFRMGPASFPLKMGIFESPLGADFPERNHKKWPGNQSHPKDIWSRNSTSPPPTFFGPKLKGPSFKCKCSEFHKNVGEPKWY